MNTHRPHSCWLRLTVWLTLGLLVVAARALLAQNSPANLPDLRLSAAGGVSALVRQPDGKIIVGGTFSSVNGVPRNNLARINPDGSLDAAWDPYVSGRVSSLALDGDHLYVGGSFPYIGGASQANLARLNVSTGKADPEWLPRNEYRSNLALPTGVRALFLSGSNVYVGGMLSIGGQVSTNLFRFSKAAGAALDPSWNPSPNGRIETMVLQGTDLFVGGSFTRIGGQDKTNLAKLTLGTGMADPVWNPNIELDSPGRRYVSTMAVSGSDLFCGGDFFKIGGLERRGLAKVSATGSGAVDALWNPDPNTDAAALAVVGTNLFVSGGFTYFLTSRQTHAHLAKLSTSGSGEPDATWNPSLDSFATVLVASTNDTALLVGGVFGVANGEVALAITKIDRLSGARDRSFDAHVEQAGQISAIARQPDGKFIIGGEFLRAGSLPRRRLARVNTDGTLDGTWAPRVDGSVYSVVVDGTNIFVTGSFEKVNEIPRKYLVKLTTGSDAPDPIWNPVIQATHYVRALAVAGTNLFVGGGFQSVNGIARTNLAKISTVGTGQLDLAWSPNPTGLVAALAVRNSDLFVGGQVFDIRGSTRTNLAKLSILGNGALDAAWDARITTPTQYVHVFGLGASITTLAIDGTNLFIGGAFSSAGGQLRNGLAKVSAVGSGAVDTAWNPNPTNGYGPGPINALVVSTTNLYIAGYFHGIGAQRISGLAKLSTLGAGLADPSWRYDQLSGASALAAVGDDVYAASGFSDTNLFWHAGLIHLPVADPPVIFFRSNATLVITRNAYDGPEVTHFRITNIFGGTLFRADGVTRVAPGEFITVQEGADSLSFVFTGTNASVTAVSALNETPAGAGRAATTLSFAAPPPPVFSFDRAAVEVAEDLPGSILTLTVNKLSAGAGQVSFSAQPGSAEPLDLGNGAGDYLVLTPSPLIFGNQDATKTILVLIKADLQLEGDETFTVTLSAGNDAIIAYPGIITTLIVDDECPGQHGSFTNTALPAPTSPASGSLRVNIPAPTTAQWRLAGDPVWRAPGSVATGLVPGFYQVWFKPVVGFREPERITAQIFTETVTTFSALYSSEGAGVPGQLVVVLTPDAVATNAAPGQWRISGGEWQASGARLQLAEGFYTVDFKGAPGYSPPLSTIVQVVSDQVVVRSVSYEPENAPGPGLPVVLSPQTVTAPPYCYNGLIETEDGFGSGVVVKERVVLTAAHALFDDTRLTYAKRVEWFLQKHRGDYEPIGQVPRGWYVFDGYAAQRTNDNSPGISSPASQRFDAAAMFFVGTNQTDNLPGRGGHGGFLSSGSPTNEWLTSNRLKMLTGYPLEGVSEVNQGRLHATAPTSLPFTKPYPQLDHPVYATTAIASRPGNSGGPLYVQADDGVYYPAAIYLGGGSQTLVRAIDEKVTCLINAADVSANGGGNNIGGGVAVWSPGVTVDSFQIGLVRVTLGPTNAVLAGAAWRVRRGAGDVSPYLASSDTVYPLVPGDIPIEFKPVPGFGTPMPLLIRPVANSTVPVDVIYPPFSLSGPTRLANGAVAFALSGATGRVYSVEHSMDLRSWSTLATLSNLTGRTLLTNQPPPASVRDFYRGREH